MLNLTPEHEDERRALYSFPEAKILEVKKDCVLGKHYHKVKTEFFILTTGHCRLFMDETPVDMKIGQLYEVKPCVFHEFHIKAGSVLIGLNSKPFNPEDDYKV